jgi:hypothetical protein
LAAGSSLLACGGATPGADQILALPEAVQRQAHATCLAGQGINAPEAIQTLRLRDGRVSVFVADGPGVSLAQARSANQCARAQLLAGGGTAPSYQGQPVYEAAPPVYQDQYTTAAPGYWSSQPGAAVSYPVSCDAGMGSLQRGDLVCPGY